MKTLALIALCAAAGIALAQDSAPKSNFPPKGPFLMDGLSDLHHPVTTNVAEAQKFFDQGLRLVYAFNHEEAARSFQHAAELDPKMAMAWWGVALAAGPNYNLPVDPEHEKISADAIDKARALEANATEVEKDYIETLAKRFSHDAAPDYQALNKAYAGAMRALAAKYPDDPDACTLYADSLMNLHPWKLWNADGTPGEDTPAIVATLEGVLKENPHHIGAMHLYIHAVEASPHPERALPEANEIAALAPAAGHLVHMPAHIYERTGNYNGARVQNEAAAGADEQYAKTTGSEGMYMAMYYNHNLHFGAISAGMQGRCADALELAGKLEMNLIPTAKEMPMVEPFLGIPMAMEVRCARWDALLMRKAPQTQSAALNSFWLYSRGMALAAKGRVDEAGALHAQLAALEAAQPHDELFMPPVENHTWQIEHIEAEVLAGRIAEARGDRKAAIADLRDAVAAQDTLLYNEPQDWYYPVRESLGGTLLRTGEDAEAEAVFRKDLEENPRNPRSLFGLAEALKRQHKDYEAGWVHRQFEQAWKGADTTVTVDSL
jgi:tetratricopeptide (TPR) repeat protein